jgi:hypothetical protein
MRLLYGAHSEPVSFAELLARMPDKEFKNTTRSTLPLLAWWSQKGNVANLGRRLGVPDLESGEANFEYPVSPACDVCGSKGKASFSDVLVTADQDVVAVEAKCYEPLYGTVGKWLRSASDGNRERVMRHWLACCIRTPIGIDACQDLVYQMVHRTASACLVGSSTSRFPHVVHLLFGSGHVDKYRRATSALSAVLGLARMVKLTVVRVPTERRAIADLDHVALEARPGALRNALMNRQDLFEFHPPEVVAM